MTSAGHALAIARNDLRLLRQDPMAAIVLVVMPLVVMAFVKPAFAPVLQQQGHPSANGAEQAVPGMALMFVFFMVTFGALAFFREHVWGTWDRLRSLPIEGRAILLGKIAPPLAIVCVQQALLFGAGGLLFGLELRGSVLALVAVDAAFVVWLMAFVLATVAYARTFQQVLAISNLGAILFAAVGGALTPFDTLPGWAQAIAPLTPIYWGMRGFEAVLLDGDGLGAVLPSVGVLLGSGAAIALLATRRFRFDEVKRGTL